MKLIHGDCLDVLPTLPDNSIDLILADLPYGTTGCRWDSIIPLDDLWREYRRIIKPNCPIVLTASQPFTTTLIASNMAQFRYEWIWRKNAGSNFALTKFQPMKEHESVLVFGTGRLTYNPIRQPRVAPVSTGRRISNTGKRETTGGMIDRGIVVTDALMRCPSSVRDFKRERGLHPTQKPLTLMSYMIRTYSNPGDVVLDNVMGSGTAGVAATETGRDFIGIERDPGYFDIARERIEAMAATVDGRHA